MLKGLDASIIFPATDEKFVVNFKKHLSQRFTNYEVIPIYNAKSFFDAWRKGMAVASKTFVVLTHQDIEFYDFPNIEDIIRDKIGLIGVAGSTIITRENPWWFNYTRFIKGQLSGFTYYKVNDLIKIPVKRGHYGRVVVLDGICLITKKKILMEVGIPKERWATWDFYDQILSLKYLDAGYKLKTVPIKLAHLTLPKIKRKTFWSSEKKFCKYFFSHRDTISV